MAPSSRSSASSIRCYSGITLVETIIVLAIISILVGIGASQMNGPGARTYSNDLRAAIQQARFEAIKRNVPIAVIWVEESSEFQTVQGDPDDPCVAGGEDVLVRTGFSEYRRVTVNPGFGDGEGLVWLPSGHARSCSFGPFTPTIAEIRDPGNELRLTVTLTGRVTIE